MRPRNHAQSYRVPKALAMSQELPLWEVWPCIDKKMTAMVRFEKAVGVAGDSLGVRDPPACLNRISVEKSRASRINRGCRSTVEPSLGI